MVSRRISVEGHPSVNFYYKPTAAVNTTVILLLEA